MSTADGAPMLTITEAAERAGVKRSQIRRELDAGAFPNAAKDDRGTGRWLIPLAELDAAQLSARADADPDVDVAAAASTGDGADVSEVEALRAQLEELRVRVEIAEAEAGVRDPVAVATDDHPVSPTTTSSGRPDAQPVAPAVGSAVPDTEPPAPIPRTALNSLWLDGDRVEPEPPRRRWWRPSTSPPMALDSFWLTDEPVGFGASTRQWWRFPWWGRQARGLRRPRIRHRSDRGA